MAISRTIFCVIGGFLCFGCAGDKASEQKERVTDPSEAAQARPMRYLPIGGSPGGIRETGRPMPGPAGGDSAALEVSTDDQSDFDGGESSVGPAGDVGGWTHDEFEPEDGASGRSGDSNNIGLRPEIVGGSDSNSVTVADPGGVSQGSAGHSETATPGPFQGFLVSDLLTLEKPTSESVDASTSDVTLGNWRGEPSLVVSEPGFQRLSILSPCPGPCRLEVISDVGAPVKARLVDLYSDGRHSLVVADIGTLLSEDTTRGAVLHVVPNEDGVVIETLAENLGRVSHLEVADIDGDSRLDIVVSVFGHLRGGLYWYRQRVDRAFEKNILSLEAGTLQALPTDVDGDGDLDIVTAIAQTTEQVRLYRNQGGGVFIAENIVRGSDGCWGMSSLRAADIDLDGDMDFLLTNGDSFDQGCRGIASADRHGLNLLINDGTGHFQARHVTLFYTAYATAVADFDRDGDLDIALSNYRDPIIALEREDANLVWLEQISHLRFSRREIMGAPYNSVSLMATDWNGDGFEDLISGSLILEPSEENLRPLTLIMNAGN